LELIPKGLSGDKGALALRIKPKPILKSEYLWARVKTLALDAWGE
jgi:hypothetical protein